MQNCQMNSNEKSGYIIAKAGTEEMWIDDDGTPFLYYKGSKKRYINIILKLQGIQIHSKFRWMYMDKIYLAFRDSTF